MLKCLADAEKHAAEIEELENRTALHIDYAQEKQIEIEVLEAALEEAKNETVMKNEKLDMLDASLTNLTSIIAARDDKINSLKDEFVHPSVCQYCNVLFCFKLKNACFNCFAHDIHIIYYDYLSL